MLDIFSASNTQLEKETILGVASPVFFLAFEALIDKACRCYVPSIDVETAINLCVPEYHKKDVA